MKSILIKGGHLIDPPTRTDRPRDILIHDNRIAEIADPGKLAATAKKEDAEVIDATGLIVSAAKAGLLQGDRLHLTAEGNRRVAAGLLASVR